MSAVTTLAAAIAAAAGGVAIYRFVNKQRRGFREFLGRGESQERNARINLILLTMNAIRRAACSNRSLKRHSLIKFNTTRRRCRALRCSNT